MQVHLPRYPRCFGEGSGAEVESERLKSLGCKKGVLTVLLTNQAPWVHHCRKEQHSGADAHAAICHVVVAAARRQPIL